MSISILAKVRIKVRIKVHRRPRALAALIRSSNVSAIVSFVVIASNHAAGRSAEEVAANTPRCTTRDRRYSARSMFR